MPVAIMPGTIARRAYSITTRIKTYASAALIVASAAARRAYSITTRIKTFKVDTPFVLFGFGLAEHIPLQQGLRPLNPSLQKRYIFSQSIFHYNKD